jgi:gluconolactonase
MKNLAAALLAILGIALSAPAGAQALEDQSISRLDPALDAILAPDARLELVTTGYGFTEGNIWVQNGKKGYLLFSDIPANVIYKWTPDGKASVYLEKSGYAKPDVWRVGFEFHNGRAPTDPKFEKFFMSGSNGLTLDREGRLIICTWSGRSIDRIEKSGKRTVLAATYQGKRFNGPNDVVVRRQDGAIYFTDTYGGLRKLDKDPAKGIDTVGIFRIKDGQVTQIIDDIPVPNGLVFSPDEKILYANGGNRRYIRRYDVQPDGTVANGQLLIDLNDEKAPGITDGMKVDIAGNIYTTGPGGLWIISPEGKRLGQIPTPELAGNVAFGDADHKTLYVAARSSIYRIRVKLVGLQ